MKFILCIELLVISAVAVYKKRIFYFYVSAEYDTSSLNLTVLYWTMLIRRFVSYK